MKLLIFFILGVLIGSVQMAAVQDFCESTADSCALFGADHIHCVQPTEAFALTCPAGCVMLSLAAVTDRIVAEHNRLRNRIASGNELPFYAATRMGTMKWNVTFANLARRNVKLCTFEHDGCRNTPDYDYVGQNIGRSVVARTSTRKNIDQILDIIKAWYAENKYATMAEIRSFPDTGAAATGETIANFAQLVRDYSTRVGCAAMKCPVGAYNELYLTCNYNLITFVEMPVYTDGGRTKSCKATNPNYPYLCSASEVYDFADLTG